MTQTSWTRITSSFPLLLVEVQSSLEECRITAKTVSEFLYNLFEGECNIPNGPDMNEVFNLDVIKLKLVSF